MGDAVTDWPHTRRAVSRLRLSWIKLWVALGVFIALQRLTSDYPVPVIKACAGVDMIMSACNDMDAADAVRQAIEAKT